ncbi:MAG: erythromycin biosynthesis sensory transduction protein eryC1 [Candidatus Lindowbacteria bacterium RIFCSPLOWO2_12_FULL_62_27]|nr:MAG: erythromycin biosynthesis sensory transduction protein eryC1 [Candidatus Lindowbacteria bacterium RIFCSPLOWO2_12_FULL_62_27]
MILAANPKAQYETHKEEIDRAIQETLGGGRYVLGEQVQRFESEFAAYIGVPHAVGVGSGTDALHLALRACGIGAGDEVITVSYTAVATVAAVEMAGAQPALVDIDPDYFTLDPKRLAGALTSKTRAILVVHLYGQPVDFPPILDFAHTHRLRVIEDCAQSHGAMYGGRRVGSFGDAAAFSFYPTKNLGSLGDGGMAVTHDAELARQVRMLRQYGWDGHRESLCAGWNSRLDEIQAAILRVKLKTLDEDNEKRRRLAALYGRLLKPAKLNLPPERPNCRHACHLYVVRSAQRDKLRSHLRKQGIETLVHYPQGVHQQAAYRDRNLSSGSLSVTESACREVLSLPMYPELTEEEVTTVCRAILEFAGVAAQ